MSSCLGRMHLIYVLGHKPNDLWVEAFREVMSHSFNQYKFSPLDLLSCVHTVLGRNERIFRAMNDEGRFANGLNLLRSIATFENSHQMTLHRLWIKATVSHRIFPGGLGITFGERP